MHYTYIKNKTNPHVNLEDCIQDGGTTIPRLVPRLAHYSLPSHLLPTEQPSGNSTVFGNVLCADSVTLCRAHPLFGDVDGRSARPRPYIQPQVMFRLVRNHNLPSLTGNCQCSFSRTY